MKIAFISTMRGLPWGGSEELWFDAAKEAVRQGHQVFVSVGHWGKSAAQMETMRNLGIQIHFQEPSRRNLQKSDIVGRVRAKAKQIIGGEGFDFLPAAKFQPDVICVSQANTYDIMRFPNLRDFLEKQAIPYAVVCHGHEDVPLPDDDLRRLTKTHFEKAVWVGFVAQSLINSAERHLAATIGNGFVVRNPVNLASTDEVPFPLLEKTAHFAVVGRLESYQKGHDILFEALSDKKWKGRDWQLNIAGEGVHLQYLQELAEHYKIAGKIKFLGQISNIRNLWAENHLLLLPSRYEGTPLTLVEAMLCARPAVVTNIAGNCEWIGDGLNGFVAEAPNAASIGKALEAAWEKRLQWKTLGAAARQTALEKYPENSGAVLLDLLINRNNLK